jgi:hypothetical protein
MTPFKLKAEPLRYLRGPVTLAHAGGRSLPGHWSLVILGARLNLLATGEREMASEEEALAYLHLASLHSPLSQDWATIMLYLAQRVLPRWGIFRGDEPIWKAFGSASPIRLNDPQLAELCTLRRRIRRAVGSRPYR